MTSKIILFVLLSVFAAQSPLFADTVRSDEESLVCRLYGVSSPEELDEYELERALSFLRHPLEINISTRSRLLSCGFLSQYQVASLLDWRSSSGDILSLTELSCVEGFGELFVKSIAPFVSFSSDALPGRATLGSRSFENELTLRSGVKGGGKSPAVPYGFKYRFTVNGRYSAAIALNSPSDSRDHMPDNLTFHVAVQGKKRLGQFVLGDFNLRYGQGAALWNGLRISSVNSTSAFARNPTGIVPYWSYSGGTSVRGAAADFSFGRFLLSASVGFPNLREAMSPSAAVRKKAVPKISARPAVNLSYWWRTGQAGMTAYVETAPFASIASAGRGGANGTGMVSSAVVSADLRCCVHGWDIFAEAGWNFIDKRPFALAGTRFKAVPALTLAFRGEYVSRRLTVAAAGDWTAGVHSGNFGVESWCDPSSEDSAPAGGKAVPRHQTKFRTEWVRAGESVSVKARLDWRHRNWDVRERVSLRSDAGWHSGHFETNARLEWAHGVSNAFLAYLEGGWKPDVAALHVRAGAFIIDNWDDRIYVYERDAPGSFSVPAFYGRGLWVSLTASWKFARWGRLYLRGSTTQYPWKSPGASSARTASWEVRAQLSFDLISSGS